MPRMLVPTPAKVAEPSSLTTMMAPRVGTIWLPVPTKAWDAASSRVLRLMMDGTLRPDLRSEVAETLGLFDDTYYHLYRACRVDERPMSMQATMREPGLTTWLPKPTTYLSVAKLALVELYVAASELPVAILKHAVYPQLENVVLARLTIVLYVGHKHAPILQDAGKPTLGEVR